MLRKILFLFFTFLIINPIFSFADSGIPYGNAYSGGGAYGSGTQSTTQAASPVVPASPSSSGNLETIQPQISNVNNAPNLTPGGSTSNVTSIANKSRAAGSTNSIPDEFQQSVFIRTGLNLQRFGYNLFNTPSTFLASDNVPASSNYVLGPGDQIIIRGWGAVDINYEATIDKEGGIVIPKVGRVSLNGITAGNLDNYLKGQIGKNFRNFSVSATVSKLRSIQITVAGFAQVPGTYTVSSLSTLTDAVFASGGPSSQGSLRRIELKRNGVTLVDYDMYDLLLKGNSSSNVRLAPGDIVYIRPVGKQVAIYDGVKVPGIYEVKDNETVADVVKFAGGYTYNNSKNQLIIEKVTENKQIDVTNYGMVDGLKQVLYNGEIIHFFRMPDRYHDAIVLIGNVVNPSRFSWHNGITIKDIIPSKEALLTKSFWNSYNYNSYSKDLSKELSGLEKTTNAGNSGTKTASFSSGLNNSLDNSDQTGNIFSNGSNVFNAGPISIPEANINWRYAVVIRLNQKTYSTDLIPFNLGLAIDGDSKNNIVLQPGDVINVLSSKDMVSPIQNSMINVFIDGEVATPGIYQFNSGSTIQDAIEAAGGITNDAYLYGIDFDRETVKKQQTAALNQMLDNVQQSLLSQAANSASQVNANGTSSTTQVVLAQQQAFIDKLRTLKPTGRVVLGLSPNKVTLADLPKVKLENGDAIHIPARTNTINVLGQVYNPATFIYNEKKSVGDYIDMAGTPNSFADTSSIYVLHADGTLYSKQQAGWFGAFNSLKIYPGDAIVVPQSIQFMTLQQNLINWTQILANFGLGIAAINQL